MTDARVKCFFDQVVKAATVAPDTDYERVYTLQFVDEKAARRKNGSPRGNKGTADASPRK